VKHLKMLVPVVLAVIAAMAIVGASAASATVLCKTNTTPCSEKYAVGTEIKASLTSGTSAKFVSNGGELTYTCTGGALGGKIEAGGSSTETVRTSLPTSSFSWSGCVWPMTAIKSGEMEVHWISGTTNGTVTAKGLEISVDTSALGAGFCTYALWSEQPHIGVLTGGVTPTLHLSATLIRTSGPICRTSLTWTATYTVTSPTPLYVREA
jgi:hypothetical protein